MAGVVSKNLSKLLLLGVKEKSIKVSDEKNVMLIKFAAGAASARKVPWPRTIFLKQQKEQGTKFS